MLPQELACGSGTRAGVAWTIGNGGDQTGHKPTGRAKRGASAVRSATGRRPVRGEPPPDY